ncbi:hypothetical protein BU15DRAFT_67118 [Melanogaster broomeanus]|nr:hypothetical protein BU15DRAFT_67118 [Melanogaster broomeanus]
MSVPSEFLNALFIRKSLFFAGHSLLVYDYLLTFSRERFKVEYVWGAPWTVVKAIFLLNRYGNLIGQSVVALEETGILSHGAEKFCVGFGLFVAAFMIFSTETIHTTVTAAELVAYQYLDEVGVCIVAIPPLVCVTCVVTLLLDTGMFATVMHSLRELTSDSRHLYPSPLLHLLVRDAVAFYIMGLTALQTRPKKHASARIILPPPLDGRTASRTEPPEAQTRHYTTRDLSREVNRQMAAMGGTSFWQAVQPWPNGAHEAGHEAQSGVGSADPRQRSSISDDGGGL